MTVQPATSTRRHGGWRPGSTLLGGVVLAAAAVGPASGLVGLAPVAGTVIKVATDGTGQFTSVQAAVNSVPDNTPGYTIVLKKGTYVGQVDVPSTKRGLTIKSAKGVATDVVITAAVPASKAGSLSASATLRVSGTDITVRGLTVENAYDEAANGNSQALALHCAGDRQVYRRVRLIGDQDTVMCDSKNTSTQNRVYIVGSYITGTTDYLFGNSAIVVDRTELHTRAGGGVAVAAPSTNGAWPHGILVNRSTFTSEAPGTTTLGRPWHPGGDSTVNSMMVVRASTLGSHIETPPWDDMSGFRWKDSRFFEFKNTGPGSGTGTDRPQLTPLQAAQHTVTLYLNGSDGWDPRVVAP